MPRSHAWRVGCLSTLLLVIDLVPTHCSGSWLTGLAPTLGLALGLTLTRWSTPPAGLTLGLVSAGPLGLATALLDWPWWCAIFFSDRSRLCDPGGVLFLFL